MYTLKKYELNVINGGHKMSVTKTRLTVTVDPKSLLEAKGILKQTGITVSGFVNVILKGLVESEVQSMKRMMENMVTDFQSQAVKNARGKRKSP